MDSSSDATTRRTPRRRPDLNINTGPASAGRPRDIIVETPPGRKSKQRQQTTPSTTTSRALSRGPTATSLLSSRDVEGSSFLDNMTPVDVVSHRDHVRDIVDHDPSNGLLEAGNRDSHDLSLPARQVTRDSLVANMLLSLDQLSMDQLASAPTRGVGGGPYDTYGNEAATMSRVSVNMMTAGHGANGGAGHAYGYPSDTDGQEDVSRVHTSRGRTRSNSSAAYQPTIGRLNSLRSQQRADPPTSKHSRGAGKDSMGGSSTNGSIDGGYAHVIDSQRWPQTFGASRPAGLDQGGQHAGAPQTQWQADLSNSFLDDEYDAAPTPTVYSGPRRLPPSPIKPPTYPPPIPNQELHQPDMEPRSPGLERKRSTRSSRSARKESRLNRDHHVPPVPNIDLDSAPAPLVGYEKSKDPVLGGPPSTNATKERPGFFRRVFGGGSSRSNLNNVSTEPFPDASPYYTSTSGEMGDDRPNSHSRPPLTANNSRGAQSTPPSRDASHPPNVLQKKPSSFFRRRRKTSVSEPENPLPPPLPMPMVSSVTPQVRLPFDKDGASPVVSAPSPVSSLRRVMNPYLKGSPTTTATPSPLTSPEPTHQQGTLSKPLGGEASERELMGVSNSNGIHEAAYKPRGPIMDVNSNGIHEASYKSREPAMDAGNSNGIHESAYKSHEPIVDVGNSNGIGGAAYKSRDFESEYERRLPSSLVTPPHAVAPLQPDIAPIPIRRTDTPTRQPPEPPVERQLPEPPVERPPPKPDGGASFLADGTDDSDDGGEGDTTLRPHEPDAESYHLSPHSRGRSPAAKEPGGRDTLRPAAVSPGSRSVGGSSSRAESSNRSNLGLPIQDGNASASSRPATGSSADGVQKQPQRNKDKPLPSVREPSSTAAARRATCPGTVTTKNAEDSSSSGKPLDEPDFVVGEPSEDDRAKARAIYDGDESFVSREKAAAWMGEEGPVRQRTLRAYLELHDFRDTSIVDSLRLFCTRLMLRAETQQLDRILVAFSARWCECNPNHGFKSMDIIHTICYSIMLLNTDMYLADIETKMTRSQFVKNTMTTIRQTLAELAPETLERPTILPGRSNSLVPLEADGRLSVDQDDRRPSIRASFKPPPRSESNASALTSVSATKDCGPLVKAPFDGPQRAWEAQVESVLKDFYASIKEERLPLFGGSPDANNSTPPPHTLASQSSLSVMAGVLRRSPSVLSKAPSETPSSIRGRTTENPPRASTSGGTGDRQHQSSRWTSKSRSRPRGTAAGTAGGAASSSRTSFDDGGSLWSPAGSSAAWSRYSLGRTQTSMSMDSFGSAWPRNANGSATTVGYDRYPASIGFANALSQAIIREENTVGGGHFGPLGSEPSLISADDGAGTTPRPLLDDESLELAGPPWIKEGIVVHKHHLDGVDKKAKDRNWTEVFAVIQKGHMSLFSFAAPSKSLRNKSRFGGSSRHNAGAGHSNQLLSPSSAMSGAGGGVIVGGGNWQSNATNVGSFSLRQTLASVLPPPGYSRQRPHVWALSLPTGAVHLFQCGTPEVAREFVATANYWAARLSTHPLVGAISNVEYGWGDAIVNNPLVAAINDQGPASPTPRPPSSSRGFGIGGSRPGSSAGTSGPLSGLVGAGRQSMQSARASLRSAGGGGDFRPGSRTGSRHGTSSLPPSSSYGYGTHGSVTAASGYPRGPQHSARGSNASSTFSSHGHHGVHLPHGLGHSHGSLPGDRVHISDWTPPTQSMRASTRCEADQLDALLAYVRSIEEELQTHNRLRSPMLLAFSPRSSAGAKAMANWEKKSAYLLREIVKFRTYVDALSGAATRREEVYEERRREERAKNPGLACKSSPSVAAVERENGDAASTAQEHEDHVSRRGNNDNVSDLSDDEAAPAAHEVSPTTATTPKMPSVPAPPLPVPGAPPVPAAYAAQMAREAREREAEAGSDEEQGDVTLRPT